MSLLNDNEVNEWTCRSLKEGICGIRIQKDIEEKIVKLTLSLSRKQLRYNSL